MPLLSGTGVIGAINVEVREPPLRDPGAVLLVAEQYQLFSGVAVEDLSRLRAEPSAPVPDHPLAQEATLVLLAGPPPGLVLEGELVGYRARSLRAQLLAGQLPDDSQIGRAHV